MSNWISITPDNLNDIDVAAEVDALRTAALAEGQTDPAPRVIQSSVDAVRAAIASHVINVLDADLTTIPKSVSDLVGRMVIRKMKGRLHIPLEEDERTQWTFDEAYLKRIATGDITIEKPDTVAPVDEVQATSGTPIIKAKRRRFSRSQQEGV